MRLGLRPTVFQKDTEWSRIRKLYGNEEIVWERHRHRYEINPECIERIEKGNPDAVARSASKDNPFARPPPERAPSLPEVTFGLPKDAPQVGPPAEQLVFVGKDERGERMQIAEMKGQSAIIFCIRRLPLLTFLRCRSPLLCRFTSAPRVRLAAAQPIATIPRAHRSRRRSAARTNGSPAKRLRRSSSEERHDSRIGGADSSRTGPERRGRRETGRTGSSTRGNPGPWTVARPGGNQARSPGK